MTDTGTALWDGRPLGTGPLAVVVCATKSPDRSGLGTLLFGAASNGETGVGLLREQWGMFIEAHSSATLVCYDAAELHWLLCDYFRESRNESAQATLWGFSRAYRLIDVGQLDQEIRRVLGDGFLVQRESLTRLAERFSRITILNRASFQQLVGQSLPRRIDELDLDRLKPVVQVAQALRQIHDKLLAIVNRLEVELASALQAKTPKPFDDSGVLLPLIPTRRTRSRSRPSASAPSDPPHDLPLPSFESRGPLGTGLDVNGAIAFLEVSRLGLAINPEAIANVKQRVDDDYRQAAASLRGSPYTYGYFEWETDLVHRGPDGQPSGAQAAYRAILTKHRHTFVDRMGLPVQFPNHTGDSSAVVSRLGVWSILDTDLATLGRLVTAGETGSWLDTATSTAHPSYENVCGITSRKPNLSYLQHCGDSTFRPHDGYRFLAVNLIDLRTRCLATLCLFWNHRVLSHLYSVFSREAEPISKLSGELREAVRRYDGPQSDKVFASHAMSLTQEWWLCVTRCLLEILPLGLAVKHQLQLLHVQPVLDNVSDGAWSHLSAAFLKGVSPELRNLLGERAEDELAAKMPVNESAMPANLIGGHYLNPDNRPPKSAGDARLERHLEHRTVDELIDHASPVQPAALLCSKSAKHQGTAVELLKTAVSLPTGRQTARWYPADSRHRAWELFVVDVVKRAAFMLVANGYRLVAVTAESLVVEVARGQPQLQTANIVEQLCREATAELLGAAAIPCRCMWCDAWPAPR